jgi:hypothetical protein
VFSAVQSNHEARDRILIFHVHIIQTDDAASGSYDTAQQAEEFARIFVIHVMEHNHHHVILTGSNEAAALASDNP